MKKNADLLDEKTNQRSLACFEISAAGINANSWGFLIAIVWKESVELYLADSFLGIFGFYDCLNKTMKYFFDLFLVLNIKPLNFRSNIFPFSRGIIYTKQ